MLGLVKDTPLGVLVFPATAGFEGVMARARELGLVCAGLSRPPDGVEMVKGEWPGIRMTPGEGDASSGPTGAPWIDSNGWLVRLTRLQKPGKTVWLAADPPKDNEVLPLARHLIAIADAAAHGGRWVVTLDKSLADGLAARAPKAVSGWQRMTAAMRFFDAHAEWGNWTADAELAVVSSFAGGDEFFSHELLNLTARTNVPYSIVTKTGLRPESLRGLHAAIYPDTEPPSAAVRQILLDFVERGGLLITGPKWGAAPGTPVSGEPYLRYQIRGFGKGRIAMANQQPDDPYEVAQDAQILVSHRYDQVRLFNSFVLGAYATVSPDGKRRLEHLINYGGGEHDDPATAWIAGRARTAKLWSLANQQAQPLELIPRRDGMEVHLPRLEVYGGLELEG